MKVVSILLNGIEEAGLWKISQRKFMEMIFDRRAYRKAVNSKKRFAKKYGDDSRKNYPVTANKNKYIGDALGVYDVRVGDKSEVKETEKFDTKSGIIVGNIRMGFGHYRISMAIASCS